MVIEGTKLMYAKKPDFINGKSIELKGATISMGFPLFITQDA
jgi:hypothetical protein